MGRVFASIAVNATGVKQKTENLVLAIIKIFQRKSVISLKYFFARCVAKLFL